MCFGFLRSAFGVQHADEWRRIAVKHKAAKGTTGVPEAMRWFFVENQPEATEETEKEIKKNTCHPRHSAADMSAR
jgi:hypothetical protein